MNRIRQFYFSAILVTVLFSLVACESPAMRKARRFQTIDQATAAMGKPSQVDRVSATMTQYSWYHTMTVAGKNGDKRDFSDGIALYADAKGMITYRILIHYPHPIMTDGNRQCYLPVIAPDNLSADQRQKPNQATPTQRP